MSALSFSKNTPNKIGNGIEVYGKNTLNQKDYDYRVAIADEPIDAKIDGTKLFCVRVDNAGSKSRPQLMLGFTPLETFDSNTNAWFLNSGFTGC